MISLRHLKSQTQGSTVIKHFAGASYMLFLCPLTTARANDMVASLEATLPKCSLMVMPGSSEKKRCWDTEHPKLDGSTVKNLAIFWVWVFPTAWSEWSSRGNWLVWTPLSCISGFPNIPNGRRVESGENPFLVFSNGAIAPGKQWCGTCAFFRNTQE